MTAKASKGRVMECKRMRGDKPSYPICVWNGIFDHHKKIGSALWEFLWLIDAITEEQDGVGWVYGKSPLKIERIATDLGIGTSTVRRNLDLLKGGGYIVTQKAQYGLIVGVVNSRKIRPKSPDSARSNVSELKSRPLKSEQSDRSKVSGLSTKSERTELSILNDNAVRQSSKTAASTASLKPEDSVWGFLEIQPCGPISFRTLLESRWASRNGDRPSVLIGETVDAWEAADGGKLRRTPQLFRALAELRQREQSGGTRGREAAKEARPIRVLTAEEIPA